MLLPMYDDKMDRVSLNAIKVDTYSLTMKSLLLSTINLTDDKELKILSAGISNIW